MSNSNDFQVLPYNECCVNSNLDTNLEQQNVELNSELADEKLDLNKCLSVRSQDRLTDCMRQLCNTNCNNKVQVNQIKDSHLQKFILLCTNFEVS